MLKPKKLILFGKNGGLKIKRKMSDTPRTDAAMIGRGFLDGPPVVSPPVVSATVLYRLLDSVRSALNSIDNNHPTRD